MRAAKETDLRNPTWHWWEEEDLDKESAMDADARLTSHPIAVHIATENQSENAFDSEITYAKGQAFLRMLEAYLGDDVFRDGVRRYIKARAYSNATGTRSVECALGRERPRRGADRGNVDIAGRVSARIRRRDVRRVGKPHDRVVAAALPARQ